MQSENSTNWQQMYDDLYFAVQQVIDAYDTHDAYQKTRIDTAIGRLKNRVKIQQQPAEDIKSQDLRTAPGEELLSQPSESLEEIKKTWYKRACAEGIVANCGLIGRQMGHDPAGKGYASTYGPKYAYESDGVKIYVDDYGSYMSVEYNGRRVCSTHTCDKLFIPGEWVRVIDRVAPAAMERKRAREEGAAKEAREKVLNQILGNMIK